MQGSIDNGRILFAKYAKIEADLVWKVPEGVGDKEAATYGVPAVTAMQALYLHLGVAWPEKTESHRKA